MKGELTASYPFNVRIWSVSVILPYRLSHDLQPIRNSPDSYPLNVEEGGILTLRVLGLNTGVGKAFLKCVQRASYYLLKFYPLEGHL